MILDELKSTISANHIVFSSWSYDPSTKSYSVIIETVEPLDEDFEYYVLATGLTYSQATTMLDEIEQLITVTPLMAD